MGILKDIAISDEMVEAAVRVLWESGAVEISSPGMDHLLVERMLVAAMQAAGPETRVLRVNAPKD